MKSSKKGGDFWTVKLAWKQTGCLLCFHFIIQSVFKSTILGSAQISGHTCVPAVSSSVCWEQLTQWFSCRSKKYFKSFIFWQPGTVSTSSTLSTLTAIFVPVLLSPWKTPLFITATQHWSENTGVSQHNNRRTWMIRCGWQTTGLKPG